MNILPLERAPKFALLMSFTSFCFLAQWLYCVLGYEFKGQGLIWLNGFYYSVWFYI